MIFLDVELFLTGDCMCDLAELVKLAAGLCLISLEDKITHLEFTLSVILLTTFCHNSSNLMYIVFFSPHMKHKMLGRKAELLHFILFKES